MANFPGTSGPDELIGTNDADNITGLEGNDIIAPLLGYTDTVDGGQDNDQLIVDYSSVAATDNIGHIGTYNFGTNSTTGKSKGLINSSNVDTEENHEIRFTNINSFDITATTGNDSLRGGSGDDSIRGGEGNNSITSGAGNDWIDVGTGINTIDGGVGTDTLETANLSSATEAVSLSDTAPNTGTTDLPDDSSVANVEYITNATTGSGDDAISYSTDANNTFNTGAGADTINSGLGNDNVDGGTEDDVLIVDYSSNTSTNEDSYMGGYAYDPAAVYNEATGEYETSGESQGYYSSYNYDTGNYDVVNFSNIGRFDITATAADDSFSTSTGNDTIDGGAGNDTLNATFGDNDITAGEGNDLVYAYEGNDTIDGGAGDDYLNAGEGINDIDGGEGTDTLESANFSSATEAVVLSDAAPITGTIDLPDGTTVANVEYITSATTGSGDDEITYSTDVNNTFNTGAGADTINSGLGNDYVDGGTDEDVLVVDYSSNVAPGETGYMGGYAYDNYVQNEETGEYEPSGESQGYYSSYNYDTGNYDAVSFSNIGRFDLTGTAADDNFSTSTGNDTIDGGAGNDYLDAGAGDDDITAGEGNDSVSAYDGNDTIDGGAGDDYLNTGYGINNTIDGGEGTDTLEFANFSAATEAVVLSDAAPNTGTIDLPDGTSVANVEYITSATTGSGDDEITYSADANNTFNTGGGADTINSGLGDDYVDAYEGNDTIDGGAGNDQLYAGAGDDDVTAGEGNDYVSDYEGNDTIDGGAGDDAMIGGAGDDLYVVDTELDTVTEDAEGGNDSVNSSVDHTLSENVENLNLTEDAEMGTGNILDNTLKGNGADNILDGGAGNDAMTGGLGSDLYVVDSELDTVTEATNGGNDSVNSSVDHTLSENVENLSLTDDAVEGIGNILDNTLKGNGADNILDGGAGKDTMIGGAGNDTMNAGLGFPDTANGGAGDDLLVVDYSSVTAEGESGFINTGNFVTNEAGESSGYYNASNSEGSNEVSFSNINRFKITATAANDRLSTSTGNDMIDGGAGNDMIDAGMGKDTMMGGEGDDTINAGLGFPDTANGGAGNDLLVLDYSSVAAAGDNGFIDTGNFVTSEAGESSGFYNSFDGEISNQVSFSDINRFDLTGTAANDVLKTGAGNDIINGGMGNDAMTGGAGDDAYMVDMAGDMVTEAANAGMDSVSSGVNYNLGANVENLTLTDAAAEGAGNGLANMVTGNEANNKLFGNSGNDLLTGNEGDDVLNGGSGGDRLMGGLGNDLLFGGKGGDRMMGDAGNDTYVVDDAGDVVSETSTVATEIDAVQSSVSHTLTANVENLTLIGSADINGIGNTLSNTITGNAGKNTLFGNSGNDKLTGNSGNDTLNGGNGSDRLAGSAGDDVLYGGSSSDLFVFDSNAVFAANALGIDQITDFAVGSDKLVLDKTTFTALGSMVDLSSEFAVVGSDAAAGDSDAMIVYSSGTGNLFYNQDEAASGLGSGAQFASLSGIPALGADDFVIQA